jgi:anti-sigma factor RsiW
MTSMDCETTRELLPLRIRGELLPHETTRVDAHVAACAECRADEALLAALARGVAAVPAGLEQRVLAAIATPVRHRWVPAGIAMAATLAAALIGGALLMQRAGYDLTPDGVPGGVVLEELMAPMVSWFMHDDPLLDGGSTLQQLSVEQLEIVLAELES